MPNENESSLEHNNNTNNRRGTKKSNVKSCIWCDQPRSRHDLCNRCRQKVESRARRLLEQKLTGDVAIVNEIPKFLETHVTLDSITASQYHSILVDVLPFMVSVCKMIHIYVYIFSFAYQ